MCDRFDGSRQPMNRLKLSSLRETRTLQLNGSISSMIGISRQARTKKYFRSATQVSDSRMHHRLVLRPECVEIQMGRRRACCRAIDREPAFETEHLRCLPIVQITWDIAGAGQPDDSVGPMYLSGSWPVHFKIRTQLALQLRNAPSSPGDVYARVLPSCSCIAEHSAARRFRCRHH